MSRYGPLDQNYIQNTLLADNGLPAIFDTLPLPVPAVNHVPGYRPFRSRTAMTRLLEALGSNTNPYPFTLLEASANGVKGRLAARQDPRSLKAVDDSLKSVESSGNEIEFSVVWSHMAAVS